MTDKTETELLPVTQEAAANRLAEAMASAIKRLETIRETHSELCVDDDLQNCRNALALFRRIPTLSERQAVFNTRPTQGHDALVDCHDLASRVVTCVEQATTSSRITKERLVSNILHPTVMTAQMATDLAQENSEYASALHDATNLPTLQAEGDPINRRACLLASLVCEAIWGGEHAWETATDAQFQMLARQAREAFNAAQGKRTPQPEAAPDDGLVAELEELYGFLNGNSTLDGLWFGIPKEGSPPYWWRSEMHRRIGAAITALRARNGEGE